MVRVRPKANTAAWTRTTGTARTLLGRGLRNGLDHQRVDPAQGIEASDAGQAGVDDRTHPRNGQRGFGDIGRDDDLAPRAGADGAVLFFRGQFTVEREDVHAAGFAQVTDCADGAHDLIATRHEDQDVAFRLLLENAVDLFGSQIPDRTGRRARHRDILNVDGIGPAIRG